MLLKKLINKPQFQKKNLWVKGIATNSKKVRKGFIFFAIRGHKFNGEKYINEAIKKGASLIVCSKKCKIVNKQQLIFKTRNVRQLLSFICAKFYKQKPKNIIAVTGTNGKTSVADLFYQILSINKVPVASIGTLGIKYQNKIIKTDLTTPDTVLLHQTLAKIKKKKIDNVIIEASSHGLNQKRIHNLELKAGIFTNFSQDHLDYHRSMRAYLNSKLILFSEILSKKKTVISDKSIKEFIKIKKISRVKDLNLIDISKIEKKLENLVKSRFNDYQVKNLSMAFAAAKLCRLNEKKIINSINKIKDVEGRLELIKTFPNNIKVFVDFAHTPDALIKSINSIKRSYHDNISLVFGCGGNRDIKKRPIMAKIASDYCKKIYVTDDNPRNEKPEKIRKEIIRNIKNPNYFNIGARSKAIKFAIINAEPNEVILVAGKGHETNQIYKRKIFKISDKKIIKNIKLSSKKLTLEKQNFLQDKKILANFFTKSKIKNFQGISTDTRLIKKNNIFVTISGKKNDGTKFIKAAIKKGAKYIVTSKNINRFKKKILKVKNEIKFLKSFASEKRKTTKARIIAITGSAGKTSLKNLLGNLLQSFDHTFKSPKSFNNYLGVPLSLSQLKIKHKYGVFEIGMSKSGEINELSKLIQPNIAIITNVGEAHLENFKNLKGIAKAKGEIINNIREDGTIILNRDDKYFKYLEKKAKSKNINIVTFGMKKKSDVFLIKIIKTKKNKILKIKIQNQILYIEAASINIYNILSSLAVFKILNFDLKKLTKFFKNQEPTDGRGKIHNIKRYGKNFKLIDESYNANPLSVKNAINNFSSIKKQKFKKYLLLGDMLELGKKSEFFHKNLSKVINNSDIDKVFIKGNKTLDTYRSISKQKRGNIFQHEEDVDFSFNNIIANNDYLMIKGSNATGLNNLSKRIIKGF